MPLLFLPEPQLETAPMTKTKFTLITTGMLVAIVLQAAYYQVAMYGSKKATKQVYLACDKGVIVPVLNNGSVPELLTDSGLPFPCVEGKKK